ncbi:hypothetical protein [Bradyrhizobium sp. USDA 4454]
MNDNAPSARTDLQALRLMRAFLRIRDQQSRTELIKQAEGLAAEASSPEAVLLQMRTHRLSSLCSRAGRWGKLRPEKRAQYGALQHH